MKSAVVLGMVGVGLLLLIASGVWTSMFPGTSSWTQEKDNRLAEVGKRMHVLSFTVGNAEANPSMHGGPDLPKAKVELVALREESKALMDEFKGVQSRPQTMSKFMKWSGISLVLVGVAGWYAVSQSQ